MYLTKYIHKLYTENYVSFLDKFKDTQVNGETYYVPGLEDSILESNSL